MTRRSVRARPPTAVRVAVLLFAAAAFATPIAALSSKPAGTFQHRLIYVSRSFARPQQVDEMIAIVRRAAAAEYTGVVLSANFDRISLWRPEFFDRLARVKAVCDSAGIELIPKVFSAGYAAGILDHDRNLAGVVPIDERYVMSGGHAEPLTTDNLIANGDFERFDHSEKPDGVLFRDGPDEVSFVDPARAHTGGASLRFEPEMEGAPRLRRIVFAAATEPFHCYRFSCWVRAEGGPVDGFQLQVHSADGRTLMETAARRIEPGSWQEVTVVFNSLDRSPLWVYAGVWSGAQGRFWVDDVEVKRVGLVNLVRRDGTPLSVTAASDGKMEEGRDYSVRLPKKAGFNDETTDVVRVGGRLADGDTIRIQAYQTVPLRNRQIGVCPAEPVVYDIVQQAIDRIDSEIAPRSYFVSVDEWRHGGWCETCRRSGLDTGELVGRAIARVAGMIRAHSADGDVFVWSDMIDPHHNAREGYYLVKGDLSGSWLPVPRDIIVACWNPATREESLRHFDEHGFATLAATYYDTGSLEGSEPWIDALQETPGAVGIMYTTWRNDYRFLEPFAALARTPR